MRSYEIPKKVVLEAFKKVKENRGAEGIDEVSLKEFEADLDNNLYKIWNRMTPVTSTSSQSYRDRQEE